MFKSYWCGAAAIGLIGLSIDCDCYAGHPPSAVGKHFPPVQAALIVHEAYRDPTTIEPPAGCAGSRTPKVPCDAISADAAVDQAGFAGWQTFFGFIGLLIALGTFAAAITAARWAKAAALASKDAADEAKRSADAAVDQIKLAREEFAVMHRPKLRLKRIRNVAMEKGLSVRLTLELVNVGDDIAHTFMAHGACFCRKDGISEEHGEIFSIASQTSSTSGKP